MEGPNGIGKTTILRDIVFTRRFEDQNRNHFSYAEQGPEKYNISIKEYLKRFNPCVNVDLMESLLVKFDLTHLDMKSSIMTLSGGETEKLNIIACLIKDVEFIFLDEPTNNLDNESVDSLVEILEELSLNRVIVIVSHDPRLSFSKAHVIEVRQNKIGVRFFDSSQKVSLSTQTKATIKFPWRKMILRCFARFSTLANAFMLLLYAFVTIYINHIVFERFYSPAELTNQDDTILVYSVDMEFAELNQRYANSVGITINEERHYSMIQYGDISGIASRNGVDDIYMLNEKYADYLADVILGRVDTMDKVKVSIPQIVLENYILQINPYFSADYLLEGRYPGEGKKEIVLSKAIIEEEYPGTSIGDKVTFEGEEYELVGVHYLDLYILSFGDDSDYFYKYDSETYESFVEEQVVHKEEVDAPESYIYRPAIVAIQTEEGLEEQILKDLFCKYPANNYYSYSFDNDISNYENARLTKIAWVMNIMIATILGAFIALLAKKRCEVYDIEAKSVDNYYLSKPLASRIFCGAELVLNLFLYVVATFVGKSLCLYRVEFTIVCVTCSILFIAALVPHAVRWGKGYE